MVTSGARSVKKRPVLAVIIRFFLLIVLFLLLPKARAADDIFSRERIISKARVVVAVATNATIALQPQPEKVRTLVNRGVFHFTGKTNLSQAWGSIVSSNDVVGIKVYSTPGANSGTRPSVVAAVVEGLLAVGLASDRIIVWDKELIHLRRAGFMELAERYNIRVESSSSSGYDSENFYESALVGNLIWGDSEFGQKETVSGRKSFVTKLVTKEITKVISIAPLLNHNVAGTTGNLYSLAIGGVDNTHRFEQSERLAIALPEIYALESLGDKVVLNITDALICQYQGEQRSLLHYSVARNQIWFSKDPVALDALALRELDDQRQAAKIPSKKVNLEIYQNASLLELGVSEPRSIRIETAP